MSKLGAKGMVRGHRVVYDEDREQWLWADTLLPSYHDDSSRPCARCGKPPTIEGHDACLGHLDGVDGACCGHGREQPSVGDLVGVAAVEFIERQRPGWSDGRNIESLPRDWEEA